MKQTSAVSQDFSSNMKITDSSMKNVFEICWGSHKAHQFREVNSELLWYVFMHRGFFSSKQCRNPSFQLQVP